MPPFLNAILPKLGLNRHMPCVVIHGACQYGSLQMAHFLWNKDISASNLLVRQHLMVLLIQANTVSGSAKLYLEEFKTLRDYVSSSWMGSIRRFLKYTICRIKVYQAWIPTLQHVHDKMLMDWFEQEKPETATLDHLNKVRLYLGVTMLADICDNAGKWLQSWALTGYEQARHTIPLLNQGKPGKLS
eukprot:10221956-Ditylum_brightwellii.AAC.1